MTKISHLTPAELQSLLATCWDAINGVLDRLNQSPEMQDGIRRLLSAKTITGELAAMEPKLAELILQGSVAALVNLQSVQEIDAEIVRRSAEGN